MTAHWPLVIEPWSIHLYAEGFHGGIYCHWRVVKMTETFSTMTSCYQMTSRTDNSKNYWQLFSADFEIGHKGWCWCLHTLLVWRSYIHIYFGFKPEILIYISTLVCVTCSSLTTHSCCLVNLCPRSTLLQNCFEWFGVFDEIILLKTIGYRHIRNTSCL